MQRCCKSITFVISPILPYIWVLSTSLHVSSFNIPVLRPLCDIVAFYSVYSKSIQQRLLFQYIYTFNDVNLLPTQNSIYDSTPYILHKFVQIYKS